MKKESLMYVLIGILIISLLVGSVFLGIWFWNLIPHWLYFILCGIDLVLGITIFFRWRK